MAQGDVSHGVIVTIVGGSTLRVDFDSGPRSGERWLVRSRQAAGPGPRGQQLWWGQGAIAVVVQWAQPSLGGFDLTELGEDQYGRLIGDCARDGDGVLLSTFLLGAGVAVSTTEAGGPPIVTVTHDPPWPAWGFEGILEVATGSP